MKVKFGDGVHERLDKIHRQLELLMRELPDTKDDVAEMMRIVTRIRNEWSFDFASHTNVDGRADAVALKRQKEIGKRPLAGVRKGTISAGAPSLGKRR